MKDGFERMGTVRLRRVWKYELPPPDEWGRSYVSLPVGHGRPIPLSVGIQDDRMVVWASVTGSDIKSWHRFIVVSTGMEFPAEFRADVGMDARFLGTVVGETGVVWHVWFQGPTVRSMAP